MSSSPSTSPTIDIESPVFAMRFANLLRATRLERGASFRSLVKAGGQQWSKDQLRQIEDGLLTLDESTVESVSMAYGADLGSILPSRLPVAISSDGVISAGGVKAVFIPRNETSLLSAYLRLIRSMRRQRKAPMIALRREDIDIIAAHLDLPGETVVDRLTALMGATLNQRTAIAAMFATGVLVIGLAGATVAGAPERGPVDVGDQRAAVVIAASTTAADGTRTSDPVTVADIVVTSTLPEAVAPTPTTSSTSTPAPTTTTAPTAAAAPSAASSAPGPAAAPPTASSSASSSAAAPSTATPTTAAPTTAVGTSGGGGTSAEPPLVPDGPVPVASVPTVIVATDDPPVPPTTSVVATGDPAAPDPGSAEPPTVPEPSTSLVDVGSPPVP